MFLLIRYFIKKAHINFNEEKTVFSSNFLKQSVVGKTVRKNEKINKNDY